MDLDMESILITEEEIKTRVAELGQRIAEDYKGKNLLLISVLKGSVLFMTDLMRAIPIPLSIDFMAVSSYEGGTNSTGVVRIVKDLDIPLQGYDVLVVEDILDSGLTLSYILGLLENRNPASLRVCTLLDKPERRKTPVKVDYCGFTIPNEFVVGYGLDYEELYRNVPYIGILSPSIYK